MSCSGQNWQKIGEKPLLPSLDKDVWDNFPSAPHVIRVGDRLRMYYHGRQGVPIRNGRALGMERIGFAEASVKDPLVLKKHPGNPVLDLGPAGAIDSH